MDNLFLVFNPEFDANLFRDLKESEETVEDATEELLLEFGY